jgi:hypothetical protein
MKRNTDRPKQCCAGTIFPDTSERAPMRDAAANLNVDLPETASAQRAMKIIG